MSNRRRLLLGIAAFLVLSAGAGAAVYFAFVKEPGDVSNPDAEFVPTATQEAPQPKPRPKRQPVDSFTWPQFGYTPNHTRYFPARRSLRPPFRQVWRISGQTLLEFPPSLKGRLLFQLNDGGTIRGIDKNTGKVIWRNQRGHLAASSPAVRGDRLWVTLLERARGAVGRVVCLNARTGKVIWQRDLPARAESSPLVYRALVYFGSEDGTLYAMSARTGTTIWTYKAAGAIKGSPTLSKGVLYFGDYGGQVQGVYAKSGRRKWSTSTNGSSFGRSGSFYSTAAVTFGRVYLGNTDGRVYSFVERTGQLAWATRTGGYVYASPAVRNTPGLGPTVYAGSYDGNLYAFNAKDGGVRWRFNAGGRISGGATVVGDVVYVADLGNRDAHGVDARTGKRVFRFKDGGFDPVVSDGKRIYLTGYSSLYGLVPKAASDAARRAFAARKRRAAARRAASRRAARAKAQDSR